MGKKLINGLLISTMVTGAVAQGTGVNVNATPNDVEEAKIETKKSHGDIFPIKHSIMGRYDISKEAFKAFLLSQQQKYGFDYKLTCSLDEWLNAAYDEAAIEGVRADIVVAQAIKETGYFKFGGLLTYKDNNFAGIGVTGRPGEKHSFSSARIGLRAQVQHLKAYASTDSLVQGVVDPRFNLVTRGSAPSLEELAGRWAYPGYSKSSYSSLEEAAAANDSYGQQIYKLMEQARAFEGGNSENVGGDTTENENSNNNNNNNNRPETPTIIAKGQVVNVTSVLNVRSGAGTGYKAVSTFKPGQKFNIYGQENGWYKVDYSVNGSTYYGYISGSYVKVIENYEKPSVPEKPSTPDNSGNSSSNNNGGQTNVTRQGQVIGISTRLNVRSGAGTKYSVITTVANGTKFTINSESNGWYNITLADGRKGYVSSSYVKVITNSSNNDSNNSGNTDTVLKRGKVSNVSTVLNVRSGPGTSYKAVTYLRNNEQVEIIGEQGNWYKIKSTKSNNAYVSKDYIRII